MSLASLNLFTNSAPRITLQLNPSLKNPNFALPIACLQLSNTPPGPKNLLQRSHQSLIFKTHHSHSSLKAFESDFTGVSTQDSSSSRFDVDSFLSAAELLCIVSSAVISVTFAVNCAVSGWRSAILGELWKRVLPLGVLSLVGGVVIGSWIRRRQWRRICVESVSGDRESLNLIGRIEKLEEDLRSSVTIIRVLSRQLEKLGTRFRVTRKTLKVPINETAALAQKNSEATRALAVQEDILEKELGEIQKVLLAMQDQQQKQLELILAIGKSGKLWETPKREPSREHDAHEASNLRGELKQMEIHEAQA